MIKQSQILPGWVGAFQVQISNSLFYLSLFNTVILMVTFWYTSGYEITITYLPFMNLGLFLLIVVVAFVLIAVIDYKYIYPSRQAFVNDQACKHENPAIDLLVDIQKRLKLIEEKLDIDDKV